MAVAEPVEDVVEQPAVPAKQQRRGEMKLTTALCECEQHRHLPRPPLTAASQAGVPGLSGLTCL